MAHMKKHPNPGIEVGYALDFISVIRHVATKLDEAPDGMTVGGLATGYRGFPADLGRVRLHHHLKNDRAAIEFLIERAVRALGAQVRVESDRVFLAKPFDQLRYERRPIARDVQSKFRDPFNPLLADGFADNIRGNGRDDTTELSGSLQTFGWLKEFPAIQDERGVTLVGHRRLKVAEELGIEPVVKTMVLGQGDEADAYRLRLAIASNLGSKPFSEADKKRIAEYLYGEKGWTMVRIGEAIMVSQQRVSQLLATSNSRPPGRAGRPKGSTGRSKRTPENRDFVEANHVAFGGSMSGPEIQKSLGLSKGTFDQLKGDVEAKLALEARPVAETPLATSRDDRTTNDVEPAETESMNLHTVILTDEEADIIEWALQTVRPRTDREDDVRWSLHDRMCGLRPTKEATE